MIDIVNLLAMPEGKTIEFKRDMSSLQPILKTLIAFANTAGGTLLIGRDNDGAIVGVGDVLDLEQRLANAIADSIYPPLMPEIEITSVEAKSLLVVRVSHWWGPFYLKAKGPVEGVFVRLGSTNRVAGQELLDELKRSRSKVCFDQMPCPDTGIADLDRDRIKQAFANTGREIDKNKLISLGILVPYSKKLVCSNGGLILFGRDQLRDQYFPNATVRCARFLGKDKVDFVDQYDVTGTILEAMNEIPKFIRRNTRLSAKIERIQREDIPEYSPIIVREILTNALVHADYSIRGMNPRVAIYSDRMEIESPGMLPFGYTLDDFMSGVSHIRNKVIARTFRELHMMEEWGTGYKRILEVCREGRYPIPQWEELGTVVRVTLLPYSITDDKPAVVLRSKSNQLTSRQEDIIGLFRKKKKLTAKDIHIGLGEEISDRTLRADLQALKDMGWMTRVGGGPSTYWILTNQSRLCTKSRLMKNKI